MKKLIVYLISLFILLSCAGELVELYNPLDPDNGPVDTNALTNLTDAQTVSYVHYYLEIGYATNDTAANVTADVILPTNGVNGATIDWQSSLTQVIQNDGTVHRSATTNANVQLTATVTKNTNSATKSFDLTVIGLTQPVISDAETVAIVYSDLSIIFQSGDNASSVTKNITLPTTGTNDAIINWTSSSNAIISNTGTVSRPPYGEGNASVTLFATITKGTANSNKLFNLTVWEMPATNEAPFVDAGTNLTVYKGADVELTGSASDPNGDTLTLLWEQVSGTTVNIINPNLSNTPITAPSETGDLVFRLSAWDTAFTNSDTVTVTVINRPPVVDISKNDQSINKKADLTLTATANDPDGDDLTYFWEQTSGAGVTMSGTNTLTLALTTPSVSGNLEFSFIASDGEQSSTDSVIVTVTNNPPTVSAGADREAVVDSVVYLNGSASDADGDDLTYSWEKTSGPTIELDTSDPTNPWFTAPSDPTNIEITLTVSDGETNVSDSVTITTVPLFTPIDSSALMNVKESSIALGIIDDDEFLDLIVTGNRGGAGATEPFTGVYTNDGFGHFTYYGNFGITSVMNSAISYDDDSGFLVVTGKPNGGNVHASIYMNEGGEFNDVVDSFINVSSGSVVISDFNNDSNVEILISGIRNDGTPYTGLYTEDPINPMEFIATNTGSLTQVKNSSIASADVNNDELDDFILIGEDELGSSYLEIYMNVGGLNFINANFGSYKSGDISVGDFNNDTHIDLLLTGDGGATGQLNVYTNIGNGTFSLAQNLSDTYGVQYSSTAVGDIDNDGDSDFIVTGMDNGNNPFSGIFMNDGNAQFTEYQAGSITDVQYGSIALGDLDNDGDLDLVITGDMGSEDPLTQVYLNNLN